MAIAAATAATLALGVGGAELPYLAPVALLALPLLSGHYVGERWVLRLGARRASRPRRAHAPSEPPTPGPGRSFPRGGLLVAASLAGRGPPGAAPAR